MSEFFLRMYAAASSLGVEACERACAAASLLLLVQEELGDLQLVSAL
jgi:hypothetical protein